jgi:hypothetical protein
VLIDYMDISNTSEARDGHSPSHADDDAGDDVMLIRSIIALHEN